MKHRLFWKVYLTQLLLVILCTGAVCAYAVRYVHEFYLSDIGDQLEDKAALIAAQVIDDVRHRRRDRLETLCRSLGSAAKTRITIVEPDGTPIADSDENPQAMENHADRPEIREALNGHTFRDIHYSRTLRADRLYVALPLKDDTRVVAALRTSVSLSDVHNALMKVYSRIGIIALTVAALAVILSLGISRRIIGPLERIRQGAERFAQGDLSTRLPLSDTAEIRGLALVLNRMASELDEKIHAITQERNERQAVLASMVEGVLALDREQRVIGLNQAAGRLIGVDLTTAHGRPLIEIVRNADLLRFVLRLSLGEHTIEDEIVLRGVGEERFIQVHGTSLRNAAGRDIGTLLVMNDVTRIRRLEKIRREFVSNVSHELKTPITSIQGFVETLREGALSDPQQAERFLGIIAAQADRLNAIIDDLLQLSRLEQEGSKVEMSDHALRDILDSAIAACQVMAVEKKITLNVSCPPEIRVTANAPLLERAVVNLLDNAIKYTEPAGDVSLEAELRADQLLIHVRDNGCGIAAEHLPRLFERFYRVDRARSRKMGGTGLGLAIVKHIVQAHGGNASVASTPGKGSVFTMAIPSGSPLRG